MPYYYERIYNYFYLRLQIVIIMHSYTKRSIYKFIETRFKMAHSTELALGLKISRKIEKMGVSTSGSAKRITKFTVG